MKTDYQRFRVYGRNGCIEIHKNGKLSHTINLLSVECIEFVLEEK